MSKSIKTNEHYSNGDIETRELRITKTFKVPITLMWDAGYSEDV